MTTSVQPAEFTVVPHAMNRIDVATGVEFDAFRTAFEKPAPPFDRRSSRAGEAGTTSVRPRRSTPRTA